MGGPGVSLLRLSQLNCFRATRMSLAVPVTRVGASGAADTSSLIARAHWQVVTVFDVICSLKRWWHGSFHRIC